MTPIRTVGIIGAGVSGVATAVHLKAAGLDVTVFERAAVPGGVWVFDERPPPDPPYPSTKASVADFTATDQSLENQGMINPDLWHAPPGPCYEGLRNNVPTPLLEMTINDWRPGTEDIVTHDVLKNYIQDTVARYNVNSLTVYNTRVEHVLQENGRWRVKTSTLSVTGLGKSRKVAKLWNFDYLVVATGHYHSERVPETSGLKEWKKAWPDRVQHSKSYRSAKHFKDQNVLIVGAGTSSVDIAKEISPFAKKIYQSSRGGLFDLPEEILPLNAVRIGGVASYNFEISPRSTAPISDTEPIPNSVTLISGEVLHGIDRVILATGYHCSFPFLSSLHRDDLRPEDADESCLVTDGTQMHNLYLDIFYIPNPSLAFIGVPYFSATFSLFEFQAMAVARIFSGKAELPAEDKMKGDYRDCVKLKGVGKAFHSLLGQGREVRYVDTLVELVNRGINGNGIVDGSKMTGHSEKWHAARKAFEKKFELAGWSRTVNKAQVHLPQGAQKDS